MEQLSTVTTLHSQKPVCGFMPAYWSAISNDRELGKKGSRLD